MLIELGYGERRLEDLPGVSFLPGLVIFRNVTVAFTTTTTTTTIIIIIIQLATSTDGRTSKWLEHTVCLVTSCFFGFLTILIGNWQRYDTLR